MRLSRRQSWVLVAALALTMATSIVLAVVVVRQNIYLEYWRAKAYSYEGYAGRIDGLRDLEKGIQRIYVLDNTIKSRRATAQMDGAFEVWLYPGSTIIADEGQEYVAWYNHTMRQSIE